MSLVTLDIIVDIAGILLVSLVTIRAHPLLEKGREPMTAALFIFALVSVGFSLAYWVTYNVLRQDVRMPLAANEIGEGAWFLLLASMLTSVLRDVKTPAKKETILAFLYFVASVALWIAWTGEWLEDIVGGLPFGYFLIVGARSLKQTDALNEFEWRFLGISCLAITTGQIANLYVPLLSKKPLDYFCYALMFSVLIWLFIKAVLAIRHNKESRMCVSLAYSVVAFGFSVLYMSTDYYYIAIFVITYSALPFLLVALRRELES